MLHLYTAFLNPEICQRRFTQYIGEGGTVSGASEPLQLLLSQLIFRINICWYLISVRPTGASVIKELAQGYNGQNFTRHWVGTSDLSITIPALYQLSYLHSLLIITINVDLV